MSIKTYDCAGCSGYCYGGYHMREESDELGDYVRTEDHKSIVAELEQRIKELEAGQGEPVAKVVRNSAGQISIFGPAGQDFNLSQFVDCYFFVNPPTTQAAVAAFAMKAEEVCKSKYWTHRGISKLENENDEEFMRQCGHTGMANDILAEIRSLPHDESALVEFGMKVARKINEPLPNGNMYSDSGLLSEVQRVIKGE